MDFDKIDLLVPTRELSITAAAGFWGRRGFYNSPANSLFARRSIYSMYSILIADPSIPITYYQ